MTRGHQRPKRAAHQRPTATIHWESYRAEIVRLYQSEGKTLKQVMDVMRLKYDLSASERVFKNRIKSWGLDKNLKSDEILALLSIKEARDATGKESSFRIRGATVDMANVQRYLRRNPHIIAQLHSGAKPSQEVLNRIVCRTPSPSPTRSLRSPEPLAGDEEFLVSLQHYILGSADAHRWNWVFDGYCASKQPGAAKRLEAFRVACFDAAECILRGDYRYILSILDPAFHNLSEILLDEDPVMLFSIYRVVAYLADLKQTELAQQILDYVWKLSVAILPGSPLANITSKLLQLFQEGTLHRLTGRMVQLSVDSFNKSVGASNSIGSSVMKQQVILLTYGEDVFTELEPIVAPWVYTIADIHSEDDAALYCRLYHARADAYRGQQKLDEAQAELDKAATLIRAFPGAWWQNDELSWQNELRSGLKLQHGDFDLAKRLLLRAIWYRVSGTYGWGYRHSRLIGQMENILHAAGEHGRALKVKEIRRHRLKSWVQLGPNVEDSGTKSSRKEQVTNLATSLMTSSAGYSELDSSVDEKASPRSSSPPEEAEVKELNPLIELFGVLDLDDADVFDPGHPFYEDQKSKATQGSLQQGSSEPPSPLSSGYVQLTPPTGSDYDSTEEFETFFNYSPSPPSYVQAVHSRSPSSENSLV